MIAKAGRYGPYVQLGEMVEGVEGEAADGVAVQDDEPRHAHPRRRAAAADACPRVVGADPADGVEITAQNGRYGPYIKKGADSRSLETEEQLFTVTPRRGARRSWPSRSGDGRRTVTPPLRELGTDPVSEKPVVLKEGRFGLYVTDGETNASLRKGDELETIDHRAGGRAAAEPPRRRPDEEAGGQEDEEEGGGQEGGRPRRRRPRRRACARRPRRSRRAR